MSRNSESSRVPKFFCEACGTEVGQKDKLCPHCGKFFAAVKCPSCGLTGQAPAFARGCPSCGYALFASNTKAEPGKKSAGAKSRFLPFFRGSRRRDYGGAGEGDPLPLWVYVFIAVLAGILLAAIFLSPA